MKALRRRFLCSNFKEYAILAIAFSFLLVFWRRDPILGSNESLLSIWIPRSFSHLVLEMTIPPMWNDFLLNILGLSLEDYRWAIWVKYLTFFLDNVIPYSNLCSLLFDWGALLIPRSTKSWNQSHRNMQNSNAPSMEPCGTPKIISNHKL